LNKSHTSTLNSLLARYSKNEIIIL
jgi:hypothetical protein